MPVAAFGCLFSLSQWSWSWNWLFLTLHRHLQAAVASCNLQHNNGPAPIGGMGIIFDGVNREGNRLGPTFNRVWKRLKTCIKNWAHITRSIQVFFIYAMLDDFTIIRCNYFLRSRWLRFSSRLFSSLKETLVWEMNVHTLLCSLQCCRIHTQCFD